MPLVKMAAGHYRARLPIGQRQGLFRVRPLEDSRATGGRFQPDPRQAFDRAGRSIPSTMQLWPGLLALAVLLDLAELILRKWKGLAETLGLRRPESAAA